MVGQGLKPRAIWIYHALGTCVWQVAQEISVCSSVLSSVNIPLLGFSLFFSLRNTPLPHSARGRYTISPLPPQNFSFCSSLKSYPLGPCLPPNLPPHTKLSLHAQDHNTDKFGNSKSWDLNQRPRKRGIIQDNGQGLEKAM